MAKNRMQLSFAIALFSLITTVVVPQSAKGAMQHAGGKGAEVYCFMRKVGNPHEVSWQAAYALIKRQTNNIFKTSPKHAAVMIVEAVVKAPDQYQDCGIYLGDLFSNGEKFQSNDQTPKKQGIDNRYNY